MISLLGEQVASDRPDDIGNQIPSDANDVAPADPTTGRQQVDYTAGRNPIPGAQVEAVVTDDGITAPTQQLRLKAVGKDILLCISLVDGLEQGALLSVARPRLLRQTLFDYAETGQTVDGFKITYTDFFTRQLENANGAIIFQRLVPGYTFFDEDLIYASESDSTEIEGVTLIDLNVDVQRFETYGERRYLLKEIKDDTLSCVLYEGGVETGDPVLIAKPKELRRTPFDDKFVDSIYYTYTDAITRNASFAGDNEDQIIVSPWVVDFTEIYAVHVSDTGIPETFLLDTNRGSRRWGLDGSCPV
jgi:hypothetical protein